VSEPLFQLSNLEAIVHERAQALADVSYTAKLLAGGPQKAAKKFGEEAVEAALAAVVQDDEALTAEAADVLYHLVVMLKSRNISVTSVLNELQRRTVQSGLAEKASRNLSAPS
jgi:phosphoribosyl-ATP pyrophosphohydrolase